MVIYLMKAWRVRRVRDEREPQMQMVTSILEMLRPWGQKLGPYLMLVMLPGGILLALLLFLYRRRLENWRTHFLGVPLQWAVALGSGPHRSANRRSDRDRTSLACRDAERTNPE